MIGLFLRPVMAVTEYYPSIPEVKQTGCGVGAGPLQMWSGTLYRLLPDNTWELQAESGCDPTYTLQGSNTDTYLLTVKLGCSESDIRCQDLTFNSEPNVGFVENDIFMASNVGYTNINPVPIPSTETRTEQVFWSDTNIPYGLILIRPEAGRSLPNSFKVRYTFWSPSGAGGFISLFKFPVIPVSVDIKPGSYPNCFNNNGHGVIPIAILGAQDFNATEVDPTTVVLDGMYVSVKGNGSPQASTDDVNNDGILDIVVQIEDLDGIFSEGDSIGTVKGSTYGGENFQGTDSICIVQ